MSDVSMDRFAKAFGLDEKGASEPFVWGTVTAVRSDGSYTVTVGGTTNTARAAKLCHAAVGDRVLCALRSGTLCAIATVGGGTVPVSGGGTGATTAAAARVRLDITPENIEACRDIEVSGSTVLACAQAAFSSMTNQTVTGRANANGRLYGFIGMRADEYAAFLFFSYTNGSGAQMATVANYNGTWSEG